MFEQYNVIAYLTVGQSNCWLKLDGCFRARAKFALEIRHVQCDQICVISNDLDHLLNIILAQNSFGYKWIMCTKLLIYSNSDNKDYFGIFKKKWANPGLFFIYFRSSQTNNTLFTTNQCENISCISSIWCRDSNPQPLERESSPITIRPGLKSLN